jgi:cholesterol oxidase
MKKSDVLIIGSGFGGSVAAARLTQAGASVTLLERGPWRDTPAVRDAGIASRSSLPYGWKFYSMFLRGLQFGRFGSVVANARGHLEMFLNNGLSVVCCSGVGGGSHVYTALNERPAADYWDGYHGAISSARLENHYEQVMEEMGGSLLPDDDRLPNAPWKVFSQTPGFETQRSNRRMRHAVPFSADMAQRTDGGMLGASTRTKNTLDQVFLIPAMARGLVVKAMTEAVGIYRLADGQGAGYRVEAYDHASRRMRSFFADRVLLAAGTLNTVKLLLRSRDSNQGLHGMPALGTRFGANSDCLAMWRVNRKDHDFLAGTPCHGEFALEDPDADAADARFMQVGFLGFQHAKLPGFVVRWLRRNLLLVGCAVDQSDGTAVWRRGRLRIDFRKQNSPSFAGVIRSFKAIARLSGRPVTSLPFTLTAHPSGGAALGADESHGVVDHRGEVYGHPGLHVVDGAALPASPGAPPSMTIAAWSSHVCEQIVSGWQNRIEANRPVGSIEPTEPAARSVTT